MFVHYILILWNSPETVYDMLLRNGSSDRMGKGSFGLIGKHHFIFVYNPNKKQTLILVGIVM